MSYSELTAKERILRSIEGKEVDRPAWSPFLTYYWESLPREIQKKGQFAYLKEIGADPLLRGFGRVYDVVYPGCNVRTSEQGNRRMTIYETPVGNLTEGYTYSESAESWFLTDHPVSTEEDFKVLQYLYEHMELKEDFRYINNLWKEVGDDGLVVPVMGAPEKTPFQTMVEHWCGTIDLTYALYDFPEVVEECLAVMEEKSIQAAEISVKSDAEAFLFWEDSSTTNISPAFFEKYTAPSIQKWGEILHKNGKYLIHHACGHLRDLLPLMDKTPIDMIESISPPPTGNIDIAEAFTMLGEDKGLIGGIEPTFFQNCSIRELEERVEYLCEISKNRRYILANSDSCPPDVEHEKFCVVSRMVKNMTK